MAITQSRAWHTALRHKIISIGAVTALVAGVALIAVVTFATGASGSRHPGPGSRPSVSSYWAEQVACQSRHSRIIHFCL